MAKYNIIDIKPKEAVYRTLVNGNLMDDLKGRILEKLLIEKKYKDPEYSAAKLAKDLNTNTRYISAVMNVKFHMNYTSFVNKYRIDDAIDIMTDKRYVDLTIEQISDMVGFSTRQSFYASFFRIHGVTPRQYRLDHLPKERKSNTTKKHKVETT